MLKLILAVSADGYMARGLEDNMDWTGGEDKAIFRMLTSVGGACGVGYSSWLSMPKELRGRSLVPITRDGRRVEELRDPPPIGPYSAAEPVHYQVRQYRSRRLGQFAYDCRLAGGGWLLGGPSLAMEALDQNLVEQVYLCRSPVKLFEGLEDKVTPWLQRRLEPRVNAGAIWRKEQRIHVGDLIVDCWSSIDVVNRRPKP